MNKEEYYSRLKKTESKLLTDRCSFEESHNIALQQIYLKNKYIETLEKENQQLKKQKDDIAEYVKGAIENDDIEELKDSKHLLLWNEDLDKLLRMLGEIDE